MSISHFRIFTIILIGFFCTLSACSTLPQHSQIEIQKSKNNLANQNSFPILNQQIHSNLTGYYLLSSPSEALAARLALIEQAQSSLDIQYYIWHNDKIGKLFFYSLIQAANRGVHIRLLIDDNNAKSIEGDLLALVQHPNIEIKLFNPYRFRKYRQLDMVLDVKRINRRMHNKAIIADQKLGIIGGRNISDEYFNVSNQFQFADIDILLAGYAQKQISDSFNDYWYDEYSFEVRDIVNPRRHLLRYPQFAQQLNQFYHSQDFNAIQQSTQTFSQWLQKDLSLHWVKAQAFVDPVNKIRNQAKSYNYVYHQLIQHINPTQNLDIISAYFVPKKSGVKQLTQLQKSGVDVRILTNSFASNDVKFVHAFYSPYRKNLIKSGIKLYEFLPITHIEHFMNAKPTVLKPSKKNLIQGGSSHASLHAKTYIIDKKQVFIGSMNLDPRSITYNTELGVLLDSAQLAETLHQDMNDLSTYAWHLQLNPQQQIIWIFTPQDQPNHQIILDKEPFITWWQKAGLTFISWIPIENLF